MCKCSNCNCEPKISSLMNSLIALAKRVKALEDSSEDIQLKGKTIDLDALKGFDIGK